MLPLNAYATDDDNRVVLKSIAGIKGSDYINASFVDVSLLSCLGRHYDSNIPYLFIGLQEGESLHSITRYSITISGGFPSH